jgi:glycerol 3-phosphatase-2
VGRSVRSEHSILGRYDVFVIDLDGVCYLDGQLFEGVPEALHAIATAGKQLLFVTNNSYRTPRRFAEFLSKHPFHADPESVLTSSQAAARYLSEVLGGAIGAKEAEQTGTLEMPAGEANPERRVFEAVYAGGEGLREALCDAGLKVSQPEDYPTQSTPDAVVVGIDRKFTYERLRLLSDWVRRGALFVATNTDATYPTPEGLQPGAGAVVAAVRVAAGRDPVVAGKPNAPMVELVRRQVGQRNALVIGDRAETDLEFAKALGADAAIVLSGVSDTKAVASLVGEDSGVRYIARSLPALFEEPVEVTTEATGKGTLKLQGRDAHLIEELEALARRARGMS